MKAQDLNKYIDRVDLFLKGQGVPNRELLKEIADIYDATLKDKRLPRTSIGCNSCVTHMMNQIKGAHLRGELGVKKKATPINVEVTATSIDDINVEVTEVKKGSDYESLQDIFNDYGSMPWGKLKSYAKSKGINTKGKTKETILKELEQLN